MGFILHRHAFLSWHTSESAMLSIPLRSLIMFLAGAAVSALVIFAAIPRAVDSPACGEFDQHVEDSFVPVAAGETKPTSGPIGGADSNGDDVENDAGVSPAPKPNTPPVYVDMLGPSYESISLADLHLTFSQQTRDEAWAFGVESEIMQYIANNNVAELAEIEYIECRKSICEIAGYLRGEGDFDAREILDNIGESTWWYPSMSTHIMSHNSGDLDYFVVIATGLELRGRPREPRAVE